MNWQDLFVGKHPDVYEPSDDTFLLAEVVSETVEKGQPFLEVGCGTGLVSMAAARAGARVVATDRNPHAVRLTRDNGRENGLALDVVLTDLLAGLCGTFAVVAFNPPYLPTAPDEHVEGPLDWAFDGGPDGNVVALQFANQVAALAERPSTVLVIHSNLSDPAPLVARMESLGYTADVAAERAMPFERLYVRRFRA